MIRRLNLRVLFEIVLWPALLVVLSGLFLVLHEQILLYVLIAVTLVLVLRVALAFVVWRFLTVLVEPFERLVISRRGQPHTICGPGDVIVIPWRDKAIRVDLRERPLAVPVDLVCFTLDPAELAVTVDVFWSVDQPVWYIARVQDVQESLKRLIPGEVARILGGYKLDLMLGSLEPIANALLVGLRLKVHDWGINITRVTLKQAMPTSNVREALNRRMIAEQEGLARERLASATRFAIETEATAKATALQAVSDVAKGTSKKTLDNVETLTNLLQVLGSSGGSPHSS